jgi:propionyl-CoA carboxylase
MGKIASNISCNSAEFSKNASEYKELLRHLEEVMRNAAEPESEAAISKSKEREKLLCNERIEQLIDPGAAILEIAPLAGLEVYDGLPPGAGIRTCISKVSNKTVMIVANNPNVKGGTYFPLTVKKHLRAQQIAAENRLPCVYLVDSGGAFLPLQAEVFPDREHFGRIFYMQAQMSRMGVPQISAVLGSCTAGGAYVPAMSDEVVMTEKNASIFLGGPPLVKAATGEEVSAEELGGAYAHCTKSGVADHMATSEMHALEIVRDIVSHTGDSSLSKPHWRKLEAAANPQPPAYDPAEIPGIVGCDLRKSFSVREVLARLVDDSRLDEFKSSYGETVVCGFAHIEGFQVGIIANDGILFSESALKATHFIELCSQRLIPILFIQNIVGFMVGKEYEHEGIAKHGAKMVNAVACARVPKITLTIGGSYGAGNYGMCGRAYDPRFLFTWPNSRISVMGAEQAAKVLTQIKKEARETSDTELEQYESKIRTRYENEGNPMYATARLWDDGIISPLNTRRTLALALASIGFDPEHPFEFGTFRM